MKQKLSEQTLFQPLIAQFEELGWDVYQEVGAGGYGGPTLDMLAVRGAESWAIEGKTSASLHVIEQALYWVGRATRVSILTPHAREHRLLSRILSHERLGWFVYFETAHTVREDLRAPVTTHKPWPLIKRLRPEQKTFCAAGSPCGRWTPWKGTVRNALEYISRHGPSKPKDVIAGIEHHWRSGAGAARQNLVRNIMTGLIPELELRDGMIQRKVYQPMLSLEELEVI
jgi:hypothetical protein